MQETPLEEVLYLFNREIRKHNVEFFSGAFKDFGFDEHPDARIARKDNEETDRQIDDILAGSIIL